MDPHQKSQVDGQPNGRQPTQQQAGNQAGLEDRLRSMIITSNEEISHEQQHPPNQPTRSSVPPELPSASVGGLQTSTRTQPSPSGRQATGFSKSGRGKRPNQAQRRQMSAQLSIPIDTPPPLPEYPKSAQPYVGPATYSNSGYRNHHQHHRSESFNRFQHHPSSGNFPSPYHSQGTPSTPRSGNSLQDPSLHQRHGSYGVPTLGSPGAVPSWRNHATVQQSSWQQSFPQQPDVSALAMHRVPGDGQSPRLGRPHAGVLYNPGGRQPYVPRPEELAAQAALMETLCKKALSNAEIEQEEIAEKEAFRVRIEAICRRVIASLEIEGHSNKTFPPESIALRCFGSLSSGFATKFSDMDLGLLSPLSVFPPDAPGSPIPRLVEKAFLDAGLGARLLTRTRVPIIKLCEKPPEKLRLDMLASREKWENGEGEGVEPGDDKIPEETEEAEDDTQQAPESELHRDMDPGTYQHALSNFKQQGDQDLRGYIASARRLLHSLGGREVTQGNSSTFSERDSRVLDDIARAFVRGLADGELRERLGSYCTLAPHDPGSIHVYRSLAGVQTQCEGEKLILNWEKHTARGGSNLQLDPDDSRVVKSWRDLQERNDLGLDPPSFNKQLKQALDSLRSIPSMAAMSLEQGPGELPTQYYTRATTLMSALSASDTRDSRHIALRSLLATRFAAGIKDDSMRRAVSEFVEANAVQSLMSIARRLKSLALAMDYERALQKGDIYDEESRRDVEEYIGMLRGPMREQRFSETFVDYFVPVSRETLPLIQRIKKLPDPSKERASGRNRYRDRLEIPKSGVGVQCDINFSAHLALQNTMLLRCYSYTDQRVRPLVLFVKHWAKIRGINTPYKGTLSSYGYVLMMLHYLVNVVHPFVCPNLQVLAPHPAPGMTPEQVAEQTVCRGHNVAFWRDETEIKRLAAEGRLNQNRDSIGMLLRGFFEYYAHNGILPGSQVRAFDWGREVISLRTPGGLLSKQDKGWTGAKTIVTIEPTFAPQTTGGDPDTAASVKSPLDNPGSDEPPEAPPEAPVSPDNAGPSPGAGPRSGGGPKTPSLSRGGSEVKEVRHRYLFAIEDPFETDHNVARTVNHDGIVAIRDEFRRAYRIIRNSGKTFGGGNGGGSGGGGGRAGAEPEDLLSDAHGVKEAERARLSQLIDDLHGPGPVTG